MLEGGRVNRLTGSLIKGLVVTTRSRNSPSATSYVAAVASIPARRRGLSTTLVMRSPNIYAVGLRARIDSIYSAFVLRPILEPPPVDYAIVAIRTDPSPVPRAF